MKSLVRETLGDMNLSEKQQQRKHGPLVTGHRCGCGEESESISSSYSSSQQSDLKSGPLCMLYRCDSQNVAERTQPKVYRIPVVVKIYSRGYDRFALVYRDDKKYTNASVYMNLKNCSAARLDDGARNNVFYVTSCGSEGKMILFEAQSDAETSEWVQAFEDSRSKTIKSSCRVVPSLSPVIPRTSLLPTLTEESETDL